MEALALHQMARIFYSTRQFDLSIKYFEQVPESSRWWVDTLFEASWAYYQKRIHSKALGNIHTLNAPYFENQFFPESNLLKAVIYYDNCLYDRALESIAEYNEKYKPLRTKLQAITNKYEDNADLYDYVKSVRSGSLLEVDEESQRLMLSVLGDAQLDKSFNWVDELEDETKRHNEADASWKSTDIANVVLEELTLQLSLAQDESGKLARDRIERLLKELREYSRDGIKIRIEVLNKAAGKIAAETTGRKLAPTNKSERIVIDDEHFAWKFDGEYWKDELGFYRFRIASKCPKKGRVPSI